jgi:hypothetical protein
MLESPWMLRYSLCDNDWVREPNPSEARGSDKSSAADNQQERLIKIGWITGFVDGEGASQSTLSVSPIEQLERDIRPSSRWLMSLR